MARCGSLSANECYQYDGCMYSARTRRCKKDPLHAGRKSTKRTYKKRKTATKRRATKGKCPSGSRRNRSTGRCRKMKSARKSTKKRTYKKRRSTRKSTKKRRSTKRKSNVYRPRTTTARCPSIKGRQSCASALNCIWYGKKCHTL